MSNSNHEACFYKDIINNIVKHKKVNGYNKKVNRNKQRKRKNKNKTILNEYNERI